MVRVDILLVCVYLYWYCIGIIIGIVLLGNYIATPAIQRILYVTNLPKNRKLE